MTSAFSAISKTTRTTNFHPPPLVAAVSVSLSPEALAGKHREVGKHEYDDNETEDEEVKLSCLGGARGGYETDDMNTSCASSAVDEEELDRLDEEEMEQDDDEEERAKEPSQRQARGDGLLNFSSSRSEPLSLDTSVVRPKARLSLLLAEEEIQTPDTPAESEQESRTAEGEDDEDEESSVGGARGIPLEVATDSTASVTSEEEEGAREGLESTTQDDNDAGSNVMTDSVNDDEGSGSEQERVDSEEADDDDSSRGFLEDFQGQSNPEDDLDGSDEQSIDMEQLIPEVSSISSERVINEEPTEYQADSEEEDDENACDIVIGVSQDRAAPVVASSSLNRSKRTLSEADLLELSEPTPSEGEETLTVEPKKRKSSIDSEDALSLPLLPFNLGEPALPQTSFGSPSRSLQPSSARVTLLSSDEDDEELDNQLQDELEAYQQQSERGETDNSPVPLLTPPSSPLMLNREESGNSQVVCEWPSNLTVDSAYASAITSEIQPIVMSPVSLAPSDDLSCQPNHNNSKTSIDPISNPSTFLTPLLQGMTVQKL